MFLQEELRDLRRKGGISAETKNSHGAVSHGTGSGISLLQLVLAALAFPVSYFPWTILLIVVGGNPIGKVDFAGMVVFFGPIAIFAIPMALRFLTGGLIGIGVWTIALAPILSLVNLGLVVVAMGVSHSSGILPAAIVTSLWLFALLPLRSSANAEPNLETHPYGRNPKKSKEHDWPAL